MDLLKLQNEVWKIAEEKGWHESEVSFGDFISNCHAELSEAFEIYRKKGEAGITHIEPFQTIGHSAHGELDLEIVASVPAGIPFELADVVMRILDFCETNGIALYQAMEMKMIFNRTRDHRHGGKVV